jgi:hypothetical protein
MLDFRFAQAYGAFRTPKITARPCAAGRSAISRASPCRAASPGDNDGAKQKACHCRAPAKHPSSALQMNAATLSPVAVAATGSGTGAARISHLKHLRARPPGQNGRSSPYPDGGIFWRRHNPFGASHRDDAFFWCRCRRFALFWCERPNSRRTRATSGSLATES